MNRGPINGDPEGGGEVSSDRAGAAAVLSGLSYLFEYPTAIDPLAWDRAEAAVVDMGSDALTVRMREVRGQVAGRATAEREESYIATFELGAVCVPYVSAHLFGEENFKRAAFLAALRGRMQERRFDWGAELPDHLGPMLRFLAGSDPEEARELIHFCLLGAIGRMRATLPGGHDYGELLALVEAVLEAWFPGVGAAPLPVDAREPSGCALAGSGCGVTEVGGA
ncbi:MAG: hypothetical protein IT349_11995 [Candidatus Eisenbacteria bacterium]|nr:hypothetical protein [Candidatus Eisenbacteria bacterium]